MKIKSTQYSRQYVAIAAPSVGETLTKLERNSHGYKATTGALLHSVLAADLATSPMLIVSSKRISDAWCQRPLRSRPIPSINWVNEIGSSRTYWTWSGDDLAIAFDGVVALELLCDAYEAECPLLVAWATTNLVTVDELWPDQDYLDSLSRALEGAMLPKPAQRDLRFGVPNNQLPPLLSTEEERYVSEDGTPVYIASRS